MLKSLYYQHATTCCLTSLSKETILETEEVVQMQLGEKIKTLRLAMNLTQENTAQKLFISRQVLSKWECGKSYPDLEKLLAISQLFNISIDTLLKEDTNLQSHIIKQSHYKKYIGFFLLYCYSFVGLLVMLCASYAFLNLPVTMKTTDVNFLNSHFESTHTKDDTLYISGDLIPFFASYQGDWSFQTTEKTITIFMHRTRVPRAENHVLLTLEKDKKHGFDWTNKDIYFSDDTHKTLLYDASKKKLTFTFPETNQGGISND